MADRRVLLGAAAIAAAAGGWYLWASRSAEAPAPKLETATVDRGGISARVTASGTLSALVTVQVGAQVTGRVQELFADFNSIVTRGQVIAKLDAQLYAAAVEQARANAVAARANERRARVLAADAARQLARAEGLFTQRLIAEADLDTTRANRDGAVAQVEAAAGSVAQAEAALHQAEVNLAYTTIRSPIGGVVLSRNVDVGQTVAAALQAPTLFVIAEDLRKMQVDTSVAEADIGKLAAGMPATFTVDAFPGERFVGTIRQIRNAAQTVQNVVTYDAVIDVENERLALRPGMTANVTFTYAEVSDVLRIPNAALRYRPARDASPDARVAADATRRGTGRGGGAPGPSNRRTIWVLGAGGVPEPREVTVGITDGSLTELRDGELAEGARVVVSSGAAAPAGGTPGSRPGGPRGGFRL